MMCACRSSFVAATPASPPWPTARSRRRRRSYIFLMILLIGCNKNDMEDQPRYDPLETSHFFQDGQSARPLIPAARPQASTLLLSDSRHLFARLGIKLPESIVARMVVTSDGSNAWGLSESGVVYLMGLITQAEADEAVEIARNTGGVRKVVKVFEYCVEGNDQCRPRQAPAAPKPKS